MAGAAGAAAPAGRIVVATDALVATDTVRLGDVATLEGDGVQQLAGLVLGRAPGAGESRTFDGAAVLQAIRRDTGSLDGITYTIPALMRVRRATQEVNEAAVRQIVEGFLADVLGAGARDAVLRTVELSGRIQLPAGTYVARVIPPAGAPLLGRVRLQVEFVIDDRPVRTVGITADIGLNGPVVVARRPIARGETLTDADLTVERRDLSQMPRGVLTDLDDGVNRIARAAIAPYTPIRREQVMAAAAVHRGDAVLLVAERGPLRITALGEVREDAGIGEQVAVVNRTTRKSLIGRVVDGTTVGVEF
jgi:flagella basal body P-ring formation protein FlgA